MSNATATVPVRREPEHHGQTVVVIDGSSGIAYAEVSSGY
jgi:hypothetical protein